MKISRRTQKIKFISLITSILSALSLLSTGFASWWYVTYPKSTVQYGYIQAYAVDDISISITNVDVFMFSALSFKTTNSEQQTVDTPVGQITITYLVPSMTQDFSADLTLGYDHIIDHGDGVTGLFQHLQTTTADNSDLSNSVQITVNSTANVAIKSFSKNNDGSELLTTLEFTEVSEENPIKNHEFTVTYIFNIPKSTDNNDANFRNVFGKYIDQRSDETMGLSPTKFVATAQMPFQAPVQ